MGSQFYIDRDNEIFIDVISGATYPEAGETFGLCRARIRQIVQKVLTRVLRGTRFCCNDYTIHEWRGRKNYLLARMHEGAIDVR